LLRVVVLEGLYRASDSYFAKRWTSSQEECTSLECVFFSAVIEDHKVVKHIYLLSLMIEALANVLKLVILMSIAIALSTQCASIEPPKDSAMT
jgi:hypothetical protein